MQQEDLLNDPDLKYLFQGRFNNQPRIDIPIIIDSSLSDEDIYISRKKEEVACSLLNPSELIPKFSFLLVVVFPVLYFLSLICLFIICVKYKSKAKEFAELERKNEIISERTNV